jgi:hypothetical protein
VANNLDNFIPEVWSTRIIQNLDQNNLAMMICANSDYEGEVRQAGDTVHVRTFGNITVGPYTRGMTISAQDLTPAKETMVVDQSYYFAFDVDDLDAAQNDINAVQGYTGRAGVAMANHFDRYIFNFYSSAHADNDINSGSEVNITASTAGTSHVYDIIVEAGRLLDRKDVPSNGRWMVVDPYYKSLLMKDTVYFINGSELGDMLLTTATVGMNQQALSAREALNRGFVGRAGGFDIYMSNALPAPSGTSKALPFGQGKPVSFAAQLMPGSPEATRLENSFGVRIKGLSLYGGKVFSEDSKRLGYVVVDQS